MASSSSSNSPSVTSDRPSSSPASAPSPLPSKLGLLARTLFQSPEILYTFPLRIRDWHKQDVALIGQSFVHIKQVEDDGTFRHVATKSDFPGRIRAAQVIGSTNGNRPLQKHPGDHDQQHAHVLVLTLDSQELVFVTMTSQPGSHSYAFNTSSEQLPVFESWLQNPGRFLAADHYSRAVAVGAPDSLVQIFELRPRNEWGPVAVSAIYRSFHIRTQMKIAKMDFLYGFEDRRHSIGLIVLGFNQPNRLLVQIYEWSHLDHTSNPQQIIHAPPHELSSHSVPLMLIPLRKSPGSFVIVCERKFGLYHDSLSGSLRLGDCRPVADFLPKPDSGDCQDDLAAGRRPPLWVAWARPSRNDSHIRKDASTVEITSETLYIARENGNVHLLEIHDNAKLYVHHAGRLNGRVEHAFNHDGRSLSAPDGLVSGGSFSDGGAFTAGAPAINGDSDSRSRGETMTFIQTETLYNWAPLLDIASDSKSVISTSGKYPHGAVSELRYGCEAAVKAFADHDLIITRIWPFKTSHDGIGAFVSSPAASGLIYNLRNSAASFHDLDLGAIITAGRLHQSRLEVAICISQSHTGATLLSAFEVNPLELEKEDLGPIQRHSLPKGVILAAIGPHNGLVLTASRDAIHLHHLSISSHGLMSIELITERSVESTPTSVALCTVNNQYGLAAVTVTGGILLVFSISKQGGLALLGETSLPGECNSLALLRQNSSDEAIVVCGQRDGSLITYYFRAKSPLQQTSHIFVSDAMPVDLTINDEGGQTAILRTDDQAVVAYFASPESRPRLNQIHFMNRANRAFRPGPVAALGFLAEDDRRYSTIVSADNAHLYTSSLNQSPQPLPTRLDMPGDPNRVIWSTRFGVYFVATIRPFVLGTNRHLFPGIVAVDNDYVSDTADRPEESRYSRGLWTCELSNARFTSMIEWHVDRKAPDGSSKVVTFLVAATIEQAPSGANASSLWFLKVSRMRDDEVETQYPPKLRLRATQRKFSDEPSMAINSICQFDTETLIYCGFDTRLNMAVIKERRFNFEATSAPGSESSTLYSSAIAGETGQLITVKGGLVFLTTKEASLKIYRMEVVDGRRRLVIHGNDQQARLGLGHVVCPVPSSSGGDFVLWTDKDGRVLGHVVPARRTGFTTTFEAKLPVSLNRLIHADVRPPWKRGLGQNESHQVASRHVVIENILGTSTDGSLWSLKILTPCMLKLLKFVEHLCLRTRTICPGSDGGPRDFQGHLMPETHSSMAHVDGDILAILVDRGDARELLASMLESRVEGMNNQRDFSTVNDRIHAFNVTVEAVMADSQAQILHGSPPAVHSLSLNGNATPMDEERDEHKAYFWRNVCTTIAAIERLTEDPF